MVPEATDIITYWSPDAWQLAAVVDASFMEVRDLGSTNISVTDSLCDFGKPPLLAGSQFPYLYNQRAGF